MSREERDANLRRSLLNFARDMAGKSSTGWVTCSKLAIAARDENRHGVDSNEHAARLIDDLIAWRLLTEKERERVQAGIGAGDDLRYRLVKITDMAWELLLGHLDPIPGVADLRAK